MIVDLEPSRAWCQALARTLPVQHIGRRNQPYLDRYFAAGWSPRNRRDGPALFLHHFVGSDPAESVHTHPWGWSASVILVGGYREERCSADGRVSVREYLPGEINIIAADDKHRIDLLSRDCWTLFLAGSFAKNWHFEPRCGDSHA